MRAFSPGVQVWKSENRRCDARSPKFARQQLVEVVDPTGTARLLEPLVIHGEALDQILAQTDGGPLAEVGPAVTADPVADARGWR